MTGTPWWVPDPKLPERVASDQHTAVIGGGLAGVSAATILSEHGVRVTLIERQPSLGGRLQGWKDCLSDGTEFEMERGFHAFFRQYYNLRRLLRRIDPSGDQLRPIENYPVCDADGNIESFGASAKKPPFNLIDMLRRSSSFRWRDLLSINRKAARAMLRFDMHRTYAEFDELSAKTYLDSLAFPEAARRLFFDIFAHSFFNPEEHYSAAEMQMMFHFYFLANAEGLAFDVYRTPYDTGMWQPFEKLLTSRGAQLLTDTSVDSLSRSGEGWQLQLDGAELHADDVVIACDVPGVQSLVKRSHALGTPEWRERLLKHDVTHPFAVWRVWLDRKINRDRPAFLGTSGCGLLDNISIYEKFEDVFAEWSRRTGGSVIELHAYALDPNLTDSEIRQDMWSQFQALYTESEGATVVDERFLLRRDCPAFPPGMHRYQATVETFTPSLKLAGDYVRLPIPTALMERATASGLFAANQILARHGTQGEPIYSVPLHGMLP